MTDYEQGFRDGIEASAKVCDEYAERTTRFTASELEAFYGTNRDRAEDDAPINDMAEIEGVFV